MPRRKRPLHAQQNPLTGDSGPATVVCCQQCDHRLGVIWPYDSSTPAWVGTLNLHPDHKSPPVHEAGWNSVTCARCGFTWRGRDGYLYDLAHEGGRVRLGQPVKSRRPPPAPPTQPMTSRDW